MFMDEPHIHVPTMSALWYETKTVSIIQMFSSQFAAQPTAPTERVSES